MTGSAVPILAFHKVDPVFEWGVTRIPPVQFRRVLDYLKRNGYATVGLSQAVRSDIPISKAVVLTFDDAYESVYRHALPALLDAGFTAAVFVITGFVGTWNAWDVNLGGLRFRHLSWERLRELDRLGFDIGSHTVHHPDLTQGSGLRRMEELRASKEEIEFRLGKAVPWISFPFGRYDERVVEDSRACGYEAGFGFLSSRPRKNPFVFERKAVYLLEGDWNLRAKLQTSGMAAVERAKLRFINFCSRGTSLVKPTRWTA